MCQPRRPLPVGHVLNAPSLPSKHSRTRSAGVSTGIRSASGLRSRLPVRTQRGCDQCAGFPCWTITAPLTSTCRARSVGTPGPPGSRRPPASGPPASGTRSATTTAAGVDGARPPRSDGRPPTRWPGAPPATERRRGSGTPRWLVAVASDLCARGVGSRRAPGARRDHGGGRIGRRGRVERQDRDGPDRLPTGLHRATGQGMDRCGRDRQRVPLFPSMDRWGRVKQPLRAMQPRAVADAIRSRAAAAGIDRASGHSLRVGAAVSMAQRGASLVAMQQAGGWRSPDMPAHYARQAAASRGAVATLRPEDRWA